MAISATPAKKKTPLAALVLVIILSIAVFIVKTCARPAKYAPAETKSQAGDKRGLNRNPSVINYSKHARCRMDCRHINQSEIKEILTDGKINYNKSELNGAECKKRYAVEGTTHDGQRVRIIFAPCETEVTVVTVIDIGEEWTCNCD